MIRYHIHIQGRVQGVGFRPFIYRQAVRKNLYGWVSNTKDGAHIEIVAGDVKEVRNFCKEIRDNCPEQARIENIDFWEVPFQDALIFDIKQSDPSGPASLCVTPDFAICSDCREELFDPENKRFRYPFITCTNCGPRFSITHQVPYDRKLTTMEPYEMCPSCLEEYSNPLDRRFYSQTNSCPECPIELSLFNSKGERIPLDQMKIISCVADALVKGKIIAVKGIGGYLLMADATSEAAIKELRKRKRRPSKPFAIMYPDIATAEKDVHTFPSINRMWKSPESPIILCMLREVLKTDIIKTLIAPGLDRLGIMIPYAPVFLLLMQSIKKPLIATSGNITESPIIYEDPEALDSLSGIADYLLMNNRRIVVPQDDSVVQYTPFQRRKIVLRRSRGLAPSFSRLKPFGEYNEPLLSMGAMLKSTFGIYHQNRIYISQYLGNTETLESQENFEKVMEHLEDVLGFRASRILVDLHPDYPSTHLGEQRAADLGIPLVRIQHHEAHAFAVMGENDLLDRDNILCVIWDGTGLGHDRHVWGGEFFVYTDQELFRAGHFSYYDHLSGDKMVLEPRVSLLSLSSGDPETLQQVKGKFSELELSNYLKMLKRNPLKTSSVGRIFDAVASLLGISDFNTYEGESAMYLEAEANKVYLKDPGFKSYYKLNQPRNEIIDVYDLIRNISVDVRKGSLTRGEIILKFHVTLVKIIETFASRHHVSHLAFSGGVFQNALLTDLIVRDLNEKFKLCFHKELSPNDECISYGQMIKYVNSQRKLEYVTSLNQKNLKL